jgi:hypothetical protein
VSLTPATLERIHAYWHAWAAAPAGGLAIVALDGARFARGDPDLVRVVLRSGATDLDSMLAALDGIDAVVSGEARLAYAEPGTFVDATRAAVVAVPDDDPRLAALAAASDPVEWSEASADEPCAVRVGQVEDGALLALAAVQDWDGLIGQIGVFTRASARGRGLAGQVASAATARAIERSLVPQWRSRLGLVASARVADRLGFEVLGRQAFVRPR